MSGTEGSGDGEKYEGIGCLLLCLALALLIAAGPIVAIIEAVKS